MCFSVKIVNLELYTLQNDPSKPRVKYLKLDKILKFVTKISVIRTAKDIVQEVVKLSQKDGQRALEKQPCKTKSTGINPNKYYLYKTTKQKLSIRTKT